MTSGPGRTWQRDPAGRWRRPGTPEADRPEKRWRSGRRRGGAPARPRHQAAAGGCRLIAEHIGRILFAQPNLSTSQTHHPKGAVFDRTKRSKWPGRTPTGPGRLGSTTLELSRSAPRLPPWARSSPALSEELTGAGRSTAPPTPPALSLLAHVLLPTVREFGPYRRCPDILPPCSAITGTGPGNPPIDTEHGFPGTSGTKGSPTPITPMPPGHPDALGHPRMHRH